MAAPHVSRMSVGILSAALLAGVLLGRYGPGCSRVEAAVPQRPASSQESAPARREVTIEARRCAFAPDRIDHGRMLLCV